MTFKSRLNVTHNTWPLYMHLTKHFWQWLWFNVLIILYGECTDILANIDRLGH